MTQSMTPVSTRPSTTVVRRWDPFREIEDVYDRMSHLMQGYLGSRAPIAPVDIEDTDDVYQVELDLPGVRAGDVNVELNDNDLRITGEIKQRERSGIVRRQERRVGEFEHVVTLPGEIDPERVDAKLHDGVLTVRVGKARASRPRRIAVQDQ